PPRAPHAPPFHFPRRRSAGCLNPASRTSLRARDGVPDCIPILLLPQGDPWPVQQIAGVFDPQLAEACRIDVGQAAVEVDELHAVATALDVVLPHLAQCAERKAISTFGGNVPFP